jgi:hypothetical protein
VSHEQSHPPHARRQHLNLANLAAERTTYAPCTEQPCLNTQHATNSVPGDTCNGQWLIGKIWDPGAFEELLADVSSQLFGL